MSEPALKPLAITCTSTNCEQNLHCFLRKRGMSPDKTGRCRECGAALVDWDRVHLRDPNDVDYVFEAMKLELWRHYMWHIDIPERVERLAKRYSRDQLVQRVTEIVRRSVGPSVSDIFRDGIQTPRETSDNARIYHYGQHATATCCRKCLEYWHGIPQENVLTDDQLAYCRALVMRYIDERLGTWP